MNNVYRLPDRERSLDEACEWIARLDRGLDEGETRDLQHWLADSRGNRDTLMQVAELWDKMDALSRLADLFPAPVEKKPRFAHRWWAAAASVLLLVGAALWQAGVQLGELPLPGAQLVSNMDKVYETAVGEHSTVNLPDGSVLVLNTNSLVRVHYTRASRLIDLDRGEINVQVAHDKQRPLSVVAAGRVVQAVGTAFNVQLRRDKNVELIVTEGRVRVADQDERSEPPPLPATATAVSKGERLLMNEAQPEPEQVEKIAPGDMDAKLSWRTGNLVFRGEPLAQAVEEISRYTSVRFRLEGEQLKNVRVAGLFRTGDVKGLLRTLNDNFDIASERLDDRTVVLRPRTEVAPGARDSDAPRPGH
ncbi:FecR family protein [Microbulbifer hainanensis]|uniref:FecR family protein n=1 Tax=Microbulbifer hainanensis TaxID=2735675 RepID=UPI0018681DD8|nr:FecR domain-containing protein [Microbulbifer hainanensis]